MKSSCRRIVRRVLISNNEETHGLVSVEAGTYGGETLELDADRTEWTTFVGEGALAAQFTSFTLNGNQHDARIRIENIDVLYPQQDTCLDNWSHAGPIVKLYETSYVELGGVRVSAERKLDVKAGIKFQASDTYRGTHFVVEDSEVHSTGLGIRFSGHEVRISNNVLHNIHASLISAMYGSASNNVIIDGNHL